MTTNNWMSNAMKVYLEKNPANELAIIWFAREDADWAINDYLDDIDDPDLKVTDDEWAEIAGRFNDMDWQYVSEVFQELCDDVLKRREE